MNLPADIRADSLVALVLFAAVTSITPGPNNLLLAASGANFGLRRSLPHLAGIWFGFAMLIVAAAAGVGAMLLASPLAAGILKATGIVYMLYLAWGLLQAGQPGAAADARPMSFVSAALFQFVNPKAWMMAVGAIAVFAAGAEKFALGVVLTILIFELVGLPCNLIWVLFGQGLRRWLDSPAGLRLFNLSMAALTALSAILLLL